MVEARNANTQERAVASYGAKHMKPKDKHIEAEPKTAEEYRQTADAHVQELKGFWKRFAVSGLFVIAVVVIILACLAWFAANNRVEATTSGLGAQGATFTMTAAGEGMDGAHVGYYERSERTNDEKAEIEGLSTVHSMTVTLNSNFNNNDAGGLYPGARGVITFTVTPLTTSLQGVTIDISRVLKLADDNVVNESVKGGEDNGDNALLKLVKGHLLFFRGMDDGYYSSRITDSKIVLSHEDFCEDGSGQATKPVTVNVYWVWPEYIQNFVLVGNANYYKNLFASDTSPDYTELQMYVNGGEGVESHRDEFYYGTANGVTVEHASSLAKGMSSTQLATCSALYNNADEYIGTSVKYVQLEFNAREGVQ